MEKNGRNDDAIILLMLTPPAIAEESISACLREGWGLRVAQATFLPIGADVHTAVFRVETVDGVPYFLKLRRGNFDEVAVAVPALLHARGIRRVMAPIATTTRQLWVRAHGFDWMLYPFMEGRDGFDAALSRAQWIALGESVRAIHATALPAELRQRVPREAYGPRWRNSVRAFHKEVEQRVHTDPIARRLAAYWLTRRDEIQQMVERAEQLAQTLQQRPVAFVVCHTDLHGGNVLVGADGELAIVDWDEPILAPKERDLMFVGGGVAGVWNRAEEEAWFYAGYGSTTIDPVALAYYRYERIVTDIAVTGEQIFGMRGSADDREEGLRQWMDQFLPDNVVEIAHRTYRQLP